MRLALGQPVTISTEIRDTSGNYIDPDTITLSVHKPDATIQNYTSPVRDNTGRYHQDVPATDLTQLGHYAFAWTSTGPGAGVSSPGDFDVYDPFEVAVLPLQDAKDTLNIAASNTQYDDEIAVFVATIESALERITGGPLVTRAVRDRVRVGHNYRSLVLESRPVVSVTAIIDIASGSALEIDDIDVDLNAGIIRRKLQWPFWAWGPFYYVDYKAGWGTSLPPAFNVAARVLLQHLWEIQLGPSVRPSMGGGSSGLATGWRDIGPGFAIPNRVLEIMAPYSTQSSI